MAIDPRTGNSNARTRRARALLFPIPRANNHVGMDPGDFIHFFYVNIIIFCQYLRPPLPDNIKSDIDRAILPCMTRHTCKKINLLN